MTRFANVALALCKGAAPPEWVVTQLHGYAALVGDTTEDQGDTIDRRLLECALDLQRLLRLYTIRTYEVVGDVYPACIDDVDRALDDLMPIIAEGVERPKRGPKLNISRHLCAAVCGDIWRKLHGTAQPHSPKLWEACEAYWVACGHPQSPSGHNKNWEDFLLQNI
jgi:hypothetical protein